MKTNNLLKITATSFISLCCGAGIALSICHNNLSEALAYYSPTTVYYNGDAKTYYKSINASSSGDTLLSALRSLNTSKRKKTMGYKKMGTSSSTSPFVYTDYDPATAKKDKNGQTYGTSLLSFYSGISTTSYNKEHVWPNSRGGNKVEDDIHMPRPTISTENTARGNSVYYEGKTSSASGWDPYTAFNSSIGCYNGEGIRGECARIIFYCVVASSSLVLNDNTSNSGNNMGKLTDLLEWNIKYAVNEREYRRNEGAEYLQGNRNPFIDHPEYACKIWGNTNAETQAICKNNLPDIPSGKEVSGDNANYTNGDTSGDTGGNTDPGTGGDSDNKDDSSSKKGCRASIGGSSIILFVASATALGVVIKKKKDDKDKTDK